MVVAIRPARVRPTDGLPLPPRRLMVRVAGTADGDWFLRSGKAAYDTIVSHVPVGESDAVLDFGCGCGRVLRYWRDHSGPVTGSDRDDAAVGWCARNLPFSRVERNNLAPPLPFADSTFDLVYALSVFTHLTEELQTLHPEARLLFISGYAGAMLEERVLDHRQPFLTKPFTAGSLASKVREILAA